MTTKCPYPQVIGELLQLLNCSLDLDGCHQAMRLIRSRSAAQILIKDGPYAGCHDDEEIDRQIGKPVLRRYPQLGPLVVRFEEEGAGFHTIVAWLNDFIDSIAWLSGNRPLPTDSFSFVKSEKGHGVVIFGDGEYHVRSKCLNKTWSYPTAFAMALDGWRID